MQSKDETLAKFQHFVADVGKPATIVTDGALEYNSRAFNKYYREQAIRHEFSTPYMPEDNGKIERVWGTVVGMTKCMIDQTKIPPMFWTFALRAAFHLKSWSLHSAHGSTPFEMMFGSRPNLKGLRVFGCKAFVYVEPRYRKKLDAKAVEGVFLGYATNANTYVAAVPNNLGGMGLLQTRNITFDERQPFFKEPTDKFDYVESGDRDDSGGYHSDDDGADGVAEPLVLSGPILACADGDGGTRDGGTMVQGVDDVQPAVLQIIESEQPVQQPVEQSLQRPVEQPEQSTTRSGRVRQKLAWMEEYVLNDNFNKEAYLCIAALVSSTDVPTGIQEALDDPNWKAAMKAEFDSLVDNKFGNLFQNHRIRIGSSSAASGIVLSNKVQRERSSSTRRDMWRRGSIKSSEWTALIPTPQPCDLHLCDVYGQSQRNINVWFTRWRRRQMQSRSV